ncbi:transcriptional regulator [Salmonella enterica]|uniref:helix-turn-helix domain-containing protein n=1 Tax=Salmonella enterica TaxID=28901 RepID=UPI0009B06A1E|nr:helix-turn-helix transcriptional regulator [Salmonella enterica]EAV6171744.1 transcriptional regulator [Salmonella enterica subsp. enterica serovar Havana]
MESKQEGQEFSTTDEQVKPAKDEQTKFAKDWHRVDIIAALHKKRLSLASLGRANGLGNETLINALNHSYPRGELIIANALNTTPSKIWPSRYFDPDGTPIKRTIRKPPLTD